MNCEATFDVTFIAIRGFSCAKEILKASTEPLRLPGPGVPNISTFIPLRTKLDDAFNTFFPDLLWIEFKFPDDLTK